jgi:thioredoxin 1
MAKEISTENFESLVLKSANPVLVDFWAPWCGPCRMLTPIMDELTEDNKGNAVDIVKINVDDNSDIAAKYGVRGIPCVIFLKNGEIVDGSRMVGLNSKSAYQDKINTLL